MTGQVPTVPADMSGAAGNGPVLLRWCSDVSYAEYQRARNKGLNDDEAFSRAKDAYKALLALFGKVSSG